MESTSIEINNKQLHFYRTGNRNLSPILFIHGFTDNGLCWLPIADSLKNKFDVIMPDMHGHGRSARFKPGDTVDMAKDIAELIFALNLNKPIVCGHSMGAFATFDFAARYPEVPKALSLEDPPWLFPYNAKIGLSAPEYAPMEEHPIVTWAKTLADIPYEELLDGYQKDNPSWPPELVQHMCEAKKQLDQGIIEELGKQLATNGATWVEKIHRITVPILLFTGNPQNGGMITPAIAAKACELNKNVTEYNIPDVGHLIRFDKPDEYIKRLTTFLASLNE